MSGPSDRTRQQRARRHALDILFEARVRRRSAMDVLADHQGREPLPRELTVAIVKGVHNHAAILEKRIVPCLGRGWTLERMPTVDRVLVLMGAWEMLHSDTPPKVVVAETRLLADECSTGQSAGFISGTLSTLAESVL